MGRVFAVVAVMAMLDFAPASTAADCLTAMIVDHSAAALSRYQSCRDVEQRLEALERAENDRKQMRGMSEWERRQYQADIDEFRAKRQLKP
jgi:hypothetical protein